MGIDLFPLASFVIVTTFSPGPNNISSASMGVLYGYRNTIYYLAGISAGFFLIMLLCAGVSGALLNIMPSVEPLLRVIGSMYILWLAFSTARAGYALDNPVDQSPLGFKKGFFLQTLNPKVIVYGLTLYSTFLSPAANNIIFLTVFALLFALTAFCATSTWALGGAAIKRYLNNPGAGKFINAILVMLLVYAAIDLSGVISLLE